MSQIPPPPQPGYPQPQGAPAAYTMQPQRQTSGAAVASLICGILGCVPLITGLLAVIFGIVGLRATKNPKYTGRGMAVAGLILGIVSLLLWGIVGGTAGFTGWWAYNETKAQRAEARQFAADLATGNIDAAQARCTSRVTREELKAASDKLKAWGTFQDTTMPVGSKQTTNGVEEVFVAGAATFSKASGVPYMVGFQSEGGTLKINGFLFTGNDGVVAGGVEPKAAAKKKDLFDD